MGKPLLPKRFNVQDSFTLSNEEILVAQQNRWAIRLRQDIKTQDLTAKKLRVLLNLLNSDNSIHNDLKRKLVCESFRIFAKILLDLPQDYSTEFSNESLEILAELIKDLPNLILDTYFLNPNELQKLEQYGVNLHFEIDGLTLLHVCSNTHARVDSIKLITWLVEKGFNINSNNRIDGTGTVLHVFIANEDFANSAEIINRFGPSLDLAVQDSEGKNLLVIAAKVRSEAILINLLNHANQDTIRAGIDLADKSGKTALHYTAILGCPTSAAVLLGRGANPAIKTTPNENGKDAFDYADSSPMLVSATLRQIEIHPERAYNAPSNALKFIENDDGDDILATKNNAITWYDAFKDDDDEGLVKYLNDCRKNFLPMSLLDFIQSKRAEIKNLLPRIQNQPQNQEEQNPAHTMEGQKSCKNQ